MCAFTACSSVPRITSTSTVVLDRVDKELPIYPVTIQALGYVIKFWWADPNFTTPLKLDVILGGEVYYQVVKEKTAITIKLFAHGSFAHSLIILALVSIKQRDVYLLVKTS